MTEDYTPSICIEPPQDDERALMYDDGLFPPSMYQSEYSSSGCDFPSTNYSMNESCPTAPPALFIQQADSSSELSPLDEVLFLDINYRSSISGRSSPIEAYSPASSCSGDLFPDEYLSEDPGSPYWSHQQLDFSAHSSPSLSPLTSAFNGIALDIGSESQRDHTNSVLLAPGPGFSRLRSASHSGEQGASSADLWADSRARSSSFSGSVSDFYSNNNSSGTEFNGFHFSDDSSVADSEAALSESLGTGMSWGSLSTPDNNSGFSNGDRSPHGQLSPGWRYPMQQQPAPYSESLPSQQPPPPSPSLLTVPPSGAALQRRGASRRTRSHSDLNSLAPPDLDAGRGRGQHRSALSIPNAPRSSSNGARPDPFSGPIHFSSVQTPATFSASSQSSSTAAFEDAPIDGIPATVRRASSANAAVATPQRLPGITRAISAPSRRRLASKDMGRSPASPSSSSSSTSVFKAETSDPSCFLDTAQHGTSQQEFRVATGSGLGTFKATVASTKIKAASNARRTNVATFECHFPNCTSTFTARHNLMNHINSHNKCRPHACLCGLSFTTQGVLNRHKKRCRKTSS